MRLLLLTFILHLFVTLTIGQTDTIFFDSNGQIIIKELSTFYRVCNFDTTFNNPIGDFTDYSILENKTVSSGSYSKYGKNGVFKQFDSNENIILEFSYSDNRPNGIFKKYLPNGSTLYLIKFDIEGMKIIECKDDQSNDLITDGDGTFQKSINDIYIEGVVKNYKMSGKWTLKSGGEVIFEEKFVKGIFKSGKKRNSSIGYSASEIINYIHESYHFDTLEKYEISNLYRKKDYPKLHNSFIPRWEKHQQKKGFIIVEDRGGFPGGNEYLFKYIRTRLIYPQQAEENDVVGKVIVEFTVDIDGQIKDPEIISGLGYGCDDVVLDIIKYMPDWIPGQQRGKPIALKYKLPIQFGNN